jgi:hypothetical protein
MMVPLVFRFIHFPGKTQCLNFSQKKSEFLGIFTWILVSFNTLTKLFKQLERCLTIDGSLLPDQL